jgi:hypothetical protein
VHNQEKRVPQIHFVNYERDLRRVQEAGPRAYESGDWVLGDDVREALLQGGRVYFHDSQSEPSFFGGTVTGFREVPNATGSKFRRWVILFTSDDAGVGVRTDRSGWKRESKFVS